MRVSPSRNSLAHRDKKIFGFAISILAFLLLCSQVLMPPDLINAESSDGAESTERITTCPADDKYIGRRNIILIDATDAIVKGKEADLERIIRRTAFRDFGVWEWLFGGKKVDKTTIYLLSGANPAESKPVWSYCSFPPEITWLVSDFSESKERELKKSTIKDVKAAMVRVRSEKPSTHSNIVEALAVFTSNSNDWVGGSKLILFSDLYENSDSCGFFESGQVPSFSEVGPVCKNWVKKLSENLQRSTASMREFRSSVSICSILKKPPNPKIIQFWKELFQSNLKYDVIFTCDPEQIEDRHEALNRL
jgi:hypothetical protein